MATDNQDLAMLDILLQGGWDINAAIEWCVPPALAFAVEDAALTNWFLQRGADPNAKCFLDITPLSAAVQYASIATIRKLFEHGGSITDGQLLHYAVLRDREERVEVIRYLVSKGSQVNAVLYQDSPRSFEQRKALGLGTPLHAAAERGDLSVVHTLITMSADPSQTARGSLMARPVLSLQSSLLGVYTSMEREAYKVAFREAHPYFKPLVERCSQTRGSNGK
ncbi:hypothetical protein B0A55_11464 [Friedmanniomyces simplex]|uniref:Uncharacterized protein n=1 Tax=Friedmanniomyces simplex TaxID=329884 RepID=A0A4U0W6W7_9PEZI|nr:hypothetical protein B0A55_11464 [Friedmanniomyces simplex]